MSRVYSARIAAIKAADEQLDVAGAVMASDAFFPFRDGIDAAAELTDDLINRKDPCLASNDQRVS